MADQDILYNKRLQTGNTLSDGSILEGVRVLDDLVYRPWKQHPITRILRYGIGGFAVIIFVTIILIAKDAGGKTYFLTYLSVCCFSLVVIGLYIVYDLISRAMFIWQYQRENIRQHNEVYNAARSGETN